MAADAELAALEQRMIAATPIVLEATAEVSDDAGELPDGDVEESPSGCPLPDSALTQNSSAASTRCLIASQYSTRPGPSQSQT
jgi:hypothetical protein